jgi:hypothetical protein
LRALLRLRHVEYMHVPDRGDLAVVNHVGGTCAAVLARSRARPRPR